MDIDIFLDLIFIFSMACIMTISILHVYLQRKTTLGVHTCSCILMIFDTVCMFYFYILMILYHVHSTSFDIFY